MSSETWIQIEEWGHVAESEGERETESSCDVLSERWWLWKFSIRFLAGGKPVWGKKVRTWGDKGQREPWEREREREREGGKREKVIEIERESVEPDLSVSYKTIFQTPFDSAHIIFHFCFFYSFFVSFTFFFIFFIFRQSAFLYGPLG